MLKTAVPRPDTSTLKYTCAAMEAFLQPEEHAAIPIQSGFTLIELAIVLFVVALLLGGMLLPLAGQQDIRNFGDTQKILIESRDALLGFAMANDRLPCPASAASNGVESPAGGGACTNPYDGCWTPASTSRSRRRSTSRNCR